MKWLEVSCRVPQEASEALCAVILDWPEVQGLAVEGAIDETPPHPEYGEWLDDSLLQTDNVVVRFYLPEPATEDDAVSRTKAALALVKRSGLDIKNAFEEISCLVLDEDSWASAWKENYHPIPVGNRLIIIPEWEFGDLTAAELHSRIPIILEPGMAFGTGTHQTTQLCLETLEEVVTEGDRVLDVGCGTAILSIAAAKLGAREVLAMDIDPVAVSAARENVAKNAMSQRVTVMNGNLLEPRETDLTPVVTETGIVTPLKDAYFSPEDLEQLPAWDVVVANILRDIIILHLPVIRRSLTPHGKLLVSGFVDEQVEKVAGAMKKNGFRITDRRDKDDWVVLVAELAS
ncbi:50S ribosomal protein L11 methyltransferase [Alicyclobacillus mengziensis]|uniref:Ribosomal protein L11 methyltransferase n=1 Tax=Alicyclobacillus mengziensis TaxID=2931921 RepID=A0A9X7Z6C3_9BACL|nr:50S ribosomal protein L11 methyltransferase [Alicyclobacillus mengziensis]QSO46115.1 50S ribosomal protein L11 methyltransferase [Alicyclobacillus mengziensis]